MKKLIALLLAAVMLLSMTACGGAAEPAETAAPATEPVMQATEAPTEEPTVAPTEDPNAYTVYTLGENESYVDVAWRHGFWEVDMEECVAEAEECGATGAQAMPLSLELSQNGFRMEVDYTGYDHAVGKVVPFGTLELVGAKSEGLADISGINPEDYQGHVNTGEVSLVDDVCLSDDYLYFNFDANGDMCDIVFIKATYYVLTDNLYNIIYHVPNGVNEHGHPVLLYRVYPNVPHSPFHPTVQTLTYGDFTFEMSQFAIQCGEERYVYNYRPGMSFSDWACSELNTDGWIPWYADTVLSPDRSYVGDWGYLAMEEMMAFYGSGNVLVAEPYDGNTNHLNNSSIGGVEIGTPMPIDPSTLGGGNGPVSAIDVTGMSEEEIKKMLAEQYGLGDAPVMVIDPPEDTVQGVPSKDDLMGMLTTEEGEISMNGNISVSVAHMVNAKTPLFTPGFRVVSKKDGRVAYHSVEMGGGSYLLDDILDIYMNGIADELIPHIKLYAFPESEEFMKTLEGHTILNAHTAPLKQGDPMLTIPEDALCLTFERVPDGKEAPNSPSPLLVPEGTIHDGMPHGSLNKDAVYARYVTKDDPNFGKGVNLVFAITFDDELVYWIHMGANFHETVDVEFLAPEMRY